jgi:hypothetical protein
MINVGIMSVQAATRARDPNFGATTQPQVINLLSYGQQVVNGALDEETGSASLVLQPRTVIYQISSFLPSAVRVQGVRDSSGRDLDPIGYENLQQIDLNWPFAIADAPRSFCQCGRDLLIVHPGIENNPTTVTVIYTLLTPALATTADTTVLQPEADSALLDLTETLLVLQHRDLTAFKEAHDRFVHRMKELKGERR